MKILVKNLSGTSNDKYNKPPKGFDSWIDYWRRKQGKKEAVFHCANHDCKSAINGLLFLSPIKSFAKVGGHVHKVNDKDKSWYIVPLCSACNNPNNTEAFHVDSDDLVSVCNDKD